MKHYRLIRYGMVGHSIGMNMIMKRWLQDWIGDDKGVLYSRVISGLKGNKTIETNIALNRLANAARGDEYVRNKVLGLSSADVLAQMRSDEKFSAYAKEFDSFLKEYRTPLPYPRGVLPPLGRGPPAGGGHRSLPGILPSGRPGGAGEAQDQGKGGGGEGDPRQGPEDQAGMAEGPHVQDRSWALPRPT